MDLRTNVIQKISSSFTFICKVKSQYFCDEKKDSNETSITNNNNNNASVPTPSSKSNVPSLDFNKINNKSKTK